MKNTYSIYSVSFGFLLLFLIALEGPANANDDTDLAFAVERWQTNLLLNPTPRQLKLENKGLIIREKELFEGRWTYRLYPKRKPASLNSIIDSPCLMCPNDSRCGAWNTITPNHCVRLTAWIIGEDQPEIEISGEN